MRIGQIFPPYTTFRKQWRLYKGGEGVWQVSMSPYLKKTIIEKLWHRARSGTNKKRPGRGRSDEFCGRCPTVDG